MIANTFAATSLGIRTADRALLYATADEFCMIFNRDMDSLFSLALLLTGSERKAEQVFAAALEKCRKSTTVFRDWAKSWTRLSVIEKSIEMAAPVSEKSNRGKSANDLTGTAIPELEFVLGLNSFDRFVYVLTVLDRFTVQDCAILMKCHTKEVERARLRAFARMAEQANIAAPATSSIAAKLAS